MNEIAGRKATRKGILKKSGKDDRVKNRCNHFNEYLSKQLKINNENEPKL